MAHKGLDLRCGGRNIPRYYSYLTSIRAGQSCPGMAAQANEIRLGEGGSSQSEMLERWHGDLRCAGARRIHLGPARVPSESGHIVVACRFHLALKESTGFFMTSCVLTPHAWLEPDAIGVTRD